MGVGSKYQSHTLRTLENSNNRWTRPATATILEAPFGRVNCRFFKKVNRSRPKTHLIPIDNYHSLGLDIPNPYISDREEIPMKLTPVVAAILLSPLSLATAQEIQLSPQAQTIQAQLHKSTAVNTAPLGKAPTTGAGSLQALSPSLACAQVPTVAQAVNFRDDAYLLDRDLAAQLKISWIASGNADADKTSKVFVREFSKFATCPSTDGAGTVMYGAALRATVLIDETDVSGSVNFAVAAASATVKSRSVQVRVEGLGFQDPQISVNAAQAQTVTASGLKVENYSDFIKALSKAFDLAVQSNIVAMQVIGFTPNGDPTQLEGGLASTWALDRIAQGYGCNDAISQFATEFPNQQSAGNAATINNTYQQIAGGCDASKPLVRAVAESILNGHRLKRK